MAAEPLVVEGLIVVPIDQIAVPALVAGVVSELTVREGDEVSLGESLARLDDAQAAMEAARAETQWNIKRQLAESPTEVNLAKKSLEQSEQKAREQNIAVEIANRKGGNDLRIRAAEKAEAVASNELQRASNARAVFADSVSRSEIDGLTLAFQRSQLETKQAAFDRQIDLLSAQAADASAVEHVLTIEASRLGIDQATNNQSIAKLAAQSASHDAELAALVVARHRIESPIDGVVMRIHHRPGQWVQPGEPVVEVVRLNRLRAEGFVSQRIAMELKESRQLQIETIDHRGQRATLATDFVFVMPQVDPVNAEVQFWVEFDNPEQKILPGMRVNVRNGD